MNVGHFFIGLVMMVAGGYLFLDNIQVSQSFHIGYALFNVGSFRLTTGIILIPFIFGIGMIFYNPENDIGWVLALISLILIVFGVISSLRMRMRPMSVFELLMILGLFIGGIGLFLSAFRNPLKRIRRNKE